MLSIDCVEVAQNGDMPVVAMRHLNVQDVATSKSHQITRLRLFLRQAHAHAGFTPSTASHLLARVTQLAQPNSEFRTLLAHGTATYPHEAPLLLFAATDAAQGRMERLHFSSWREFEPRWQAMHKHALWILAEGDRNNLLMLLDAIRRDEQACQAEAPSLEPANTNAPKSGAHEEAIAFRNELIAKDWPDGKRVAEMAGTGSTTNPHQYAARQRANGALFGVWVAAERSFRHPDFQFDDHGSIRPAVADLLKVLPNNDEDKNGWRRAFWLYSRHALLSGETPADVFIGDPERVIAAAKEEFSGDPNERW